MARPATLGPRGIPFALMQEDLIDWSIYLLEAYQCDSGHAQETSSKCVGVFVQL